MMRADRLATIPASIRWKITLCLSVISSTKMADVNGVRVTPVKNPTIPDKINTVVSVPDRWNQLLNNEPTPAPAAREGANPPPEPPEVKYNIGPTPRRSAICQGEYLSLVNNTLVISS